MSFRFTFVCSNDQLVDVFIKPVGTTRFLLLREAFGDYCLLDLGGGGTEQSNLENTEK